MKKIAGQIVALTKTIWLTEPTIEPGYIAQFMVGRQNKFSFSGGFGLSWWLTKSSFKTIENIASMIVESVTEFSDCDLDSVEQTIQNTLKETCVDKHIFSPDDVCFGRKGTLFECRQSIGVDEFGLLILSEILENLRNEISKRCTVYVAPRISGPSFIVENAGLSVIAKTDEVAWQVFVQKGYQTNGWNPLTGDFAASEKTAFSRLQYDYLFVCEERGTQKGSRFSSLMKLRRLFSILFATVGKRTSYRLIKSAANPYCLCLQFPDATVRDATISMSELGALVPYYISDHRVLPEDIDEIQKWFDALSRLNHESASRIEKCAHFINRGMNTDDIESYVNYFVALDALFGERGAVEASILNGIGKLGLGQSIQERATWLFDLRNELVHGGSRYINEWPKYHRYYRHFDSRPDQDIAKLSFSALSRAPELFV